MTKPEILNGLKKVLSLVKKANRVVIVCHVNADGDALGSLFALYNHLLLKVEEITAFIFEPISDRYGFLGLDRLATVFNPDNGSHSKTILESDLLIVLDLALEERLPGWSGILSEYKGSIVCIDHHPEPENPLGSVNVIDSDAAAAGQLLYHLFTLDNNKISYEETLGLFTALATDTGWFRYSNTSPEVLSIAAKMVENGLSPSEIYRNIYQNNDLRHVKLTGKIANNVHSELDGRFLWAIISQAVIHESGVEDLENEELLDIFRSVKGCDCVALFREKPQGVVRVNLRSKGNIAINSLAEKYGGGGHPKAAGITIFDTSLEKASAEIVKDIIEYMKCQG